MRYHYLILDMKVDSIPSKAMAGVRIETLLILMDFKILAHASADYPGPANAYTSSWILAESHAILHTAPEENWVEVVLATCSDRIDVAVFEEEIKRLFSPIRSTSRRFEGSPP